MSLLPFATNKIIGNVSSGTILIQNHFPILDIEYPIISEVYGYESLVGRTTQLIKPSKGFNKYTLIRRITPKVKYGSDTFKPEILDEELDELSSILLNGFYAPEVNDSVN